MQEYAFKLEYKNTEVQKESIYFHIAWRFGREFSKINNSYTR